MRTHGTHPRQVLAVILLWSLSASGYAQDTGLDADTGPAAAPNADAEYAVTTEHYTVHSEVSQDDARDVAQRLEAFLELYNRQLRFPLEELDESLSVRLFDSRGRYEEYLRSRTGEPGSDVVYLHYANPQLRELVGYTGDGIPERSLIHHGFVQYIRAFVANPPLWLREGFAVYFAQSRYDEGFRRAVYEENLQWLDTLKGMLAGVSSRPWISWEDLLSMTPADVQVQATAESFYPQAWGLVSFLLNEDDPRINRLAWDSISALNVNSSLQENSEVVYRDAFRWEERDILEQRFRDYVASRRTFAGWVSAGVERYGRNDPDGAERAMEQALQMRTDHHLPFYYLGLINYDREEFGAAARFYQQAVERTDSPAPMLYALGVNAVADDRPEDAREYLETVAEHDSALGEEAEQLLRRLPVSHGR